MRRFARSVVALFLFQLSRGTPQVAESPPLPEVHGVWVHPSAFGSGRDTALGKIRATLDRYQRAGINTVMVLVKSTAGLLYFQSATGVRDTTFRWDFFGAFLDEARQRRITVHPWFCVFTESALPGQVRTHPEWLIRSRKGELLAVVNPSLAEVRQYEIGLVKELVERYGVEWVHLDYLRFPCEPAETYFSYDQQTRALFTSVAGEDPLLLKSTDTGNIMWNRWIEWNGEQVTAFLRELRRALARTGRPVKVSAAVFPDAVTAGVAVGQNWRAWPEEGLVEMLCPMLYTNNDTLFETYARRALDAAKGRSAVCAGIGIGTAHNQNTPAGVLRQAAIARSTGLQGFVLFSSSTFTDEFVNELQQLLK